jgi:cyclopropane-fatty-acyl-phospholipid synthase
MPVDPHARRCLSILRALLEDAPVAVGIRLWNGTRWASAEPVACELVVREPGALRALLRRHSDGALAEAYLRGALDIEGDAERMVEAGDHLLRAPRPLGARLRLAALLLRLPRLSAARRAVLPVARLAGRRHGPGRDAAAVRHHYDISNDFYRLWLDERMIYSCAYFASPADSLDEAQEQKLDHVCRKLRIRPGDRVLDIGCGWGAFAIFAAQRHGAVVHGITLSLAQAELARERVLQHRLADQCRIEIRDYRGVGGSAVYDRIVSIGMYEHVGSARSREYFAAAFRLLKPGGTFLNHAIAGNALVPPRESSKFAQRYAFPDHELLPIHRTLADAEASGFEVRDVENLREHYVLTLRHWLRRLEANRTAAIAATNDATWRAWRLVMAGAANRFTSGEMNLFQTLLVRADGGEAGVPLTRADWYASAGLGLGPGPSALQASDED